MTQSTRFPPITLTASDREQLERLVSASTARFPQTADYLAGEVERARVQSEHSANTFVHMGSRVEFRDDATGQVRNVKLVYPGDADVSGEDFRAYPSRSGLSRAFNKSIHRMAHALRRTAFIDSPLCRKIADGFGYFCRERAIERRQVNSLRCKHNGRMLAIAPIFRDMRSLQAEAAMERMRGN